MVAIITTAALMSPMLEPLRLESENAKALVVLAIGAGSMTVSHLNDSFFWVVSQFSDMDPSTALRCHTWATFLQGLVGLTVIGILQSVLGQLYSRQKGLVLRIHREITISISGYSSAEVLLLKSSVQRRIFLRVYLKQLCDLWTNKNWRACAIRKLLKK